jgi:hypothetical protein
LESVYGSTALCRALASFSISWFFYTVGRTPWTGNQPVARPLLAHRTAQIQSKGTQTSMPQVKFAPTIPALERAKTVHVLDRVATVTGRVWSKPSNNKHYSICWTWILTGWDILLLCTINIFMIYVRLQTGFGSVTRFTDHLYTPLEITSNYSAIADLHNSHINIAPAKPFSSLFYWSFLVINLNNGYSSASVVTPLLVVNPPQLSCQPNYSATSPQPPLQYLNSELTTELFPSQADFQLTWSPQLSSR